MSLINYRVSRRRSISRSQWRATHNTLPHKRHGGRGKKLGLKGGKQRRAVR